MASELGKRVCGEGRMVKEGLGKSPLKWNLEALGSFSGYYNGGNL